jgi:hypothetical protein
VTLKFAPFPLWQVTEISPGHLVWHFYSLCEYKEFKPLVIVIVTEKPMLYVLFVQILEEVDLSSSPAKCKSPVSRVGKLAALTS